MWGGGRGLDISYFAKLGAYAIDIDINSDLLKNIKQNLRKLDIYRNLEFIVASAINIPFKEEVQDMITCFSVLDHLPDKTNAHKAIVEFSRICRRLGYVVITVPNLNFLIGTISMKLKSMLELETFFEQRFTPPELFRMLGSSGLKQVVFDAEYPTIVGSDIFNNNTPKILGRVPKIMFLLRFVTRIFKTISRIPSLKIFGARMGYISKKE
ncbi:hypothetical protein A3K80_07480 [Candidatus Bathyarchaeota archaeon RBG_13_38_9]|nr:MAG: hypothetical protein A3K80_07480 [Candidatus Bathyarchaeota archaeon RBG_13_38_9]